MASTTSSTMRTFVFVSEFDRSKRLKVMRACDGCRKRKIKCDGALQNGPWPCGACVRLKLKCIPPTLDPDDTDSIPDSAASQDSFSFHSSGYPSHSATSNPINITSQPRMINDWNAGVAHAAGVSTPTSAPSIHYEFGGGAYGHPKHSQLSGSRLEPDYSGRDYFPPTSGPAQFQQSHQVPILLRTQTAASSASSGDPHEIDASARELSEQMGDLQIDITTQAPYITNHGRNAGDVPTSDSTDVALPASVYTDPMVRIPPEMMPSEERAMDYFGYYFDHIHAYVPVLHKATFMDQWQNARSSISPLLLEGIFASVARYLEEPVEARRWLALASRHEESFKDVPLVSTLQAMAILMKARESLQKRGYYYRSWMEVKYMTSMALDLCLHEHYAQHRSENVCLLSTSECLVRTRVWQTLFVLEIMVGAVQGRADYVVDDNTVQLTPPLPSNDIDAFEHQTTRRFTFMAQSVRNIKRSVYMFHSMKKLRQDWAMDPAFVKHGEDLRLWPQNLPADMQIHYPEDGSPPWLGGDHYLASLHAYHHLTVMMHHRPQLQMMLAKGDLSWRTQLDRCLSSAVQMCRLQEALYRDFGFHGLQFMTRGVNFTIYCVLTCTMLHLAAITSPDALLNSQARTYFTRHMRVLEHCLHSSSPEMIVQINALREAFSVDTSKAFELKPTLGLRSPSPASQPTPPHTNSEPTSANVHASSWPTYHDASAKTLTPATEHGPSYDDIAPHETSTSTTMPFHTPNYDVPPHTSQSTFNNHNLPPLNTATQIGYSLEPSISNDSHTPIWDPSGIFNQWNHAFGGASSAPAPQGTPPAQRNIQPTSAPMMAQQQSPTHPHNPYGPQQLPSNASPTLSSNPAAIPTVTPVMWQDAFTNAYVSGHGQKRYREASIDQSVHSAYTAQYKRRG